MKRLLKYTLILMAAALSLPSCLVHEYPQGETDVEVTLHLQFPPEMIPYKTVTRAEEEGSLMQIRYLVKAYLYSGDAWDAVPRQELTLYGDASSALDRDVSMILPAGKYRFSVWTDYTDEEGGNLFWDADNMDKVSIIAPYQGNPACREAFCGREILDFSALNASGQRVDKDVPMTRPLARYELVANDKEEFFTKFSKSGQGNTKAAYDLSGYFVRIDYRYFLPSVYDVRRDVNVDSRTGAYFTVPVYERDGEVVMAHDFVLAGDEETSVVIDMTLFDDKGVNLGTVAGIQGPLVRGGITTVRGTLLTDGT